MAKKQYDNSTIRKTSSNSGANKGVLSKSDFKYLVKKGLGYVESRNRYNEKSKISSATGKYQFLWSEWNKDIKAFAAKDARFKTLVESDAWKKNPQQAFLNSPALQESFMDFHLDRSYRETLDLYKQYGRNNNLRMDEIYAIIHHQGSGTAKANLKAGIVNYKSKDGTNGNLYLKNFNQGVYSALGMPKDAKGNYLGNKTQRTEAILGYLSNPKSTKIVDPSSIKFNVNGGLKAYNDYKKEMTDLEIQAKSEGWSNEQLNELAIGVMHKYDKMGYTDFINQSISKETQDLKNSKYKRAEAYNLITNILNKAQYKAQRTKTDDGNIKEKINGVKINAKDLTQAEKNLIKEHPELFNSTKDEGKVYVKDFSKLNSFLNRTQKEFFNGQGINFFQVDKKGNVYLSEAIGLDHSVKFNAFSDHAYKPTPESFSLTNKLKKVAYDASTITNGIKGIDTSLFSNNYDESDLSGDVVNPYDINKFDSSSSSGPSENTPDKWIEHLEKEKKATAEKEVQEKRDNDLSYFNDEMTTSELIADNSFKYDKGDYKDNLPITDLANSFGGIVTGLSMQDENNPLRNDRVSGAFESYASQMAEIAKRGLSIEDEAAAYNKITEAYSSGIAQIVKASGGHRNTVLGNLGRLDAQKNMSLGEIQIADSKMKMEGLQAYGEAMKYISEHDNDVERTNNEREYLIAQEKRRNGGDLTQAAWSAFSKSINDYENKKPGSAYHIAESYMLNDMLGYNPLLKDDGTGREKGTYSYMVAQRNELEKNNAAMNAFKTKATSSLNDNEKLAVTSWLKANPNYTAQDGNAYIDYLIQNRDKVDLDKVSKNPNEFFTNNILNQNKIDNSIMDPQKALELASPVTEQPKADESQNNQSSFNLADNIQNNIFQNVLSLIDNQNTKI
jgi:hypothetical protein